MPQSWEGKRVESITQSGKPKAKAEAKQKLVWRLASDIWHLTPALYLNQFAQSCAVTQ